MLGEVFTICGTTGKAGEHTRLEQRFRIMSNRPLLDRSCRPVSLEEDKRIRAERMSEPPVILDSEFKLTVEERIAIEIEEEASGAKPKLTETSSSYLWLCCFINGFTELSDFASVTRFVESWSSSMRVKWTLQNGVIVCEMSGNVYFCLLSRECCVFH